MHINPASRFHMERAQRLKLSAAWTKVIHDGYPPSRSDPEVAIVLDPRSPYNGEPRWGFARHEPVSFLSGGTLTTTKYLHLFAYWQAPGNHYKAPSALMVDWIRDHDSRSRGYVGEWSDDQFGSAEEENEKLRTQMIEGYRELLDQHGRPYRPQPALAPRLSNTYFGGGLP